MANTNIKAPKLNVSTIKSPLSGGGSGLGRVGQEGTSKIGNLATIVKKNRIAINSLLKIQESQEKLPTENINISLAETNKILVAIQNQLALQSQNEQKEEKENRRRESIAESKRKLKREESILEKTAKGIGKAVGKVALKVVQPIGGIFDKILEFITLMGAGIAINAAFEWFKDEENQKKIIKIFNILKENWKLLANIFGSIIAVGAILKVAGAIATIGSVLSVLANPIVLGFLAGAGLLFAMKGAYDLIGDAQAGGREFNVAHKALDKRLRDAGMTVQGDVLIGNAQQRRSGKGPKGPRSEEQEKIYQSVISGRKQLRTLQKDKDAALEGVEDDTERRKIYFTFASKIPGIVSGIEARKMGGPVIAGQPYIVGDEKGLDTAEIFVPNVNGSIVNNMRTQKIIQTLSSDMGEGSINMIELPPITNQLPPPEIPVPSGPATEVPEVSSVNLADPYRHLTPMLYGITV